MPRLTINPDDIRRAKIVKPGWYPTLLKAVTEEPNAARTGTNIVWDVECADDKSEFYEVPAKLWFPDSFPQSSVALVKAFNPKLDEKAVHDIEFADFTGLYIYGKWATNRGKDGTAPPRNTVEDWAPLPKQWLHLAGVKVDPKVEGVGGFDK